jgi:hypothetical protein
MNTGVDKKFGQFIVDFVNANSTEEAVLSCFRNLQRHFAFSPDFSEMAKNLFPSINVISVLLNNDDKKLLEQIIEKNSIINRLNEQFQSINYAIENYDPLYKTVSLMSLDWNRDTNGGLPETIPAGQEDEDSGGFLQTLKLLGLSIVDGPVTIKIDAIRSEIEALLGKQASDQISRLTEVGHIIDELIIDIDEGRYEELHLLAEEHREVIDFHYKIEDIQTDFRQIIDMEIEGKPFSEMPAFATYLETYNRTGRHRLIIDKHNRLIAQSPINELKYLTIKEVKDWLEVFRADTAYCLIEVLKSVKSRKRLKKCLTCKSYFMARRPHIQKFCSRQCRLGQPKPEPKTMPSDDKLTKVWILR